MRSRSWTLVSWALTLALPAAADDFSLGNFVFTVPAGFVIEEAATSPVVERPITAAFDERGHLYVAESSGASYDVREQLKNLPHRIVRLEDSDGDGRFDRRVIFADRMMLPEGTLWYDGALYVSAPPSIWKLIDDDGDGRCDRREEWLRRTLTGCANDLHGPYLGPDGWIYWCKGAFAEQTYERPAKKPFVSRAAHLFRARPDGSAIEPVMTGGMDNPVDVVFTPEGERIFSTTFFQHPAGGRRDGLVHAIYGGVYGKVHGVIENHPWTSAEVMPVLTHLGATAVCGLARYDAHAFGEDYEGNLFACNFNLKRITRHVLESDGSTFRTRDSDFVVCDHWDFHPTDVVVDADGSLLVVDTGGWYKICCPTSQLAKPEVVGGIYRVRKVKAPSDPDPRGLTLDWHADAATVGTYLDDARPAVTKRAIVRLKHLGEVAIPALTALVNECPSFVARRNAVWALTRMDRESARRLVRTALTDANASVRHAAVHSVSAWRDRQAFKPLLRILESDSAPLQRAAAEALGRLGNADAIPTLLKVCGLPSDRALEHSLTYALIEIDDAERTRPGLAAANARIQRATLVAVDQMESGGWRPDRVLELCTTSNPTLRSTASWLVGRHADWAEEVAEYLRSRLQATPFTVDDAQELRGHLARFGSHGVIQELLGQTVSGRPGLARQLALTVMAEVVGKELPASWVDPLLQVIRERQPVSAGLACDTARRLPPKTDAADKLVQSIDALARDRTAPRELRLKALAALPEKKLTLDREALSLLTQSIGAERKASERSAALHVLTSASLDREHLDAVVAAVHTVGPIEINRLFTAFDSISDERQALVLVRELETSKASAGLQIGRLRKWLEKQEPSVVQQGEALITKLTGNVETQHADIDKLVKLAKNGDVRRGQRVYKSEKAACATCHSIGYTGGNIGPDLTNIGQRRTERDLVEAIVTPNSSFVQSYEPMVVITKRGEAVSGILREDGPDAIVLATGPVDETRIPREEIVELRPGKVSVMPSGLDAQLTQQQLADLVAFLKVAR